MIDRESRECIFSAAAALVAVAAGVLMGYLAGRGLDNEPRIVVAMPTPAMPPILMPVPPCCDCCDLCGCSDCNCTGVGPCGDDCPCAGRQPTPAPPIGVAIEIELEELPAPQPDPLPPPAKAARARPTGVTDCNRRCFRRPIRRFFRRYRPRRIFR